MSSEARCPSRRSSLPRWTKWSTFIRSLASASGSADVLEKLGVAIDLSPKQAEKLIESVGIGFLYAPNFHPVMHKVLPPEMALGIKTMVRVKICGNTSADQVALCAASGADCVGFVVEYPIRVPWNLSRQQAAGLLSLVPPMVTRAVVTGGDPEAVLAIAGFLFPHLVQLHTDNTLEETATIAQRLGRLGIGLIRALRIDVNTGRASGEISDPVEAALALQDAGVAGVLLDARTQDMPAGTGARIDWGMARGYARPSPCR